MKSVQRLRGFTLIEILVSLMIFAILAVVANQILFTTLRGTSKSEVEARVRGEGNYALSVMERALHSSRGIVSCSSNKVEYLDEQGLRAKFICFTSGDSKVASGSASIADGNLPRITSSQVSIDVCSITCDTAAEPPSVSVQLELSKRGSGGLRPEERSQLDLQTRILLRN